MIAWMVSIVTVILLLFVFWRRASKAFRGRAEEPKYLFLESLGIPARRNAPREQGNSSQEKKNEPTQS